MGGLGSPFTFRGVKQAELLVARMAHHDFSAIYSSDLPRAFRSAEKIASAKGMGIRSEPRLRERNMGIFQGLTVPEMRNRFPAKRGEYEKPVSNRWFPMGKSARQRLDGTGACLTGLAGKHSEETFLCMTHGGILMRFFQFVLGMDPMSGSGLKRRNAAINTFEYVKGKLVLDTWEVISHLQDTYTDK